MKEKLQIKLDGSTANEKNSINSEPKPKKKKKIFKLAIGLAIFFVTIVAVFGSQVVVSEHGSISWFSRLPFVKQIKQMAESANRELKGEEQNRINILLLGMGGKDHDGGYLTDTIMLASIEPSSKKVSLTSIPRDLAVPVEDMGWKKINSINAYAETENPGSGGLATSQAVSDLLGVPIDYFFRIDFQGFIDIIDTIDGVDVLVENTLDDYSYPVLGREDAADYGSRYEHLHVEKGWQHMDGALALKFARSRHAYGAEGSDFARSRRQQLIMEASKEKVLSMKTLLNPQKIAGIFEEFNSNISTNLKIWEMLKLWDIVKDIDKNNIKNIVLDNGANGLLVSSVSDQGAYILSPKSGDFEEIRYLVKNVFADAPQESQNEVKKERATLEIRNGTWINGLASQIALDLEHLGFTITRIGNSSRQNFQKSVIFDLTYGEKPNSLASLKEKTGANVSTGMPDWLVDDINQDLGTEKNPVQPDFILILGQDADQTSSGVENPEVPAAPMQ